MVIKICCQLLALGALGTSLAAPAMEHEHGGTPAALNSNAACVELDVRCAATLTAAFDAKGRLWRAWTVNDTLYLDKSTDKGASFGAPIVVNKVPEAISDKGENRPKLGLDAKGGIYLSWAMAREARFSADIRFSYSLDGGASFSAPQTVNDDGLLAGHSFNEMQVTSDGRVELVWLDSRHRAMGQPGPDALVNGSAIYHALANPRLGELAFANRQLVMGTCQCCRLALAVDSSQQSTMMWRHIYGDNIREFALMNLDRPEAIHRVSHDEWHIEGCPHQGGALAIDSNDRYHMGWFNAGAAGMGIFYAHSDNRGESVSPPVTVGQVSRQASHPHLAVHGATVDIVWLEFDGKHHSLMHQRSTDRGEHLGPINKLAESNSGADRPFVLVQGDPAYVSWHRPGQDPVFMELR